MVSNKKQRVEAQIQMCKSVVENTTDFITDYLQDIEEPLSERWEVLCKSNNMCVQPIKNLTEIFGTCEICQTCKKQSRSNLMWRTNHNYFCGPVCEDVYNEKNS